MNQKITSSLIVFLICLSIVNAKSTGCSSKVEQLQLFPTKGEKLRINLHDNLFEGEDLTYELQDTYFKLINPVQNTGGSSTHYKPASNIRAAKPYHTKKMQSWLNSFVFLDQNALEVSIQYSEGTALDKIPTPGFGTKVVIANVVDNLECYDVEYIDNDKFIVDCQKEVTEKLIKKQIDVFYIYSKQSQKVTSFEDEASVKIYNQRRIGLYYSTSALGKETTYIVRVTPTYSLDPNEQLSGNSIVQVYTLSDNYQPLPRPYILDNVTMAFLLGKTDVELSIVDFEMTYNGYIFLLDAQYGLFVVKFQPTGKWELFAQADFQLGRSFAFDIDYEHKKDGSELGVVAVLGYNFFAILDTEKSYVHNLPFMQLDYPATIKISQDNIIVRSDKQVYFYKLDVDTDTIYLNYKVDIPSTDVLLVNPQEPDLIQISTQSSNRYTISNGYLAYNGSDKVQDKKVVAIKAKAPNKQECQVFLSYQIIEDNENWIYQLFDKPVPFPNVIADGETDQVLKKLASGPNLQYRLVKPTQLEATNIKATIRSRVELSLNQELPKNVIYAEIVSTEDDTQFYQVLQTQDLKVQILNCVHNSIYVEDAFCELLVADIGISSKVSKQNFSIWNRQGIIYFMYISEQYNVVIRAIHNGAITPVKTISLDSTDTANKIQSILNCGDYLLVHKANNEIVTFLIYRPELFALTTLNKNSFSQYGYNEEWEPKALFTNKKLHPNILFILHKNHILMLDTDYGMFSFIKTIPITPNLDYSIAIGQSTFFVVQGKSAQDVYDAQIYEYNFAEINHVYLQKKLYLYWYDISTPLNVDFSEETGNLFVRGVCLYCSKSFILVFKPNTPQHEALVQAWDIADVVIPETKSILIAANGFKQNYLYLNVEGEQSIFAVYDQTTMTVESFIDSTIYQDTYSLNFQIRNYNFQGKPEKFNTVDITQDVTTISTLTQINLDENAFPYSKSGIQIFSTDDQATFDLGQGWYSGQIGDFEIDCDQCETNVELQSTVDLLNPKIFNGYEIRDHVKYNDKFNIMQATTGLIFVNPDNSLASVYDFDLPNFEYQCYQATVSEDKMVVYSLCNDGTEFTVYATGCFSITGCSPLGEKFKLGVASKIQVVSNELLVVLHTDADHPELIQDGKIVLYRIAMGLDNWKLEVIEIIDLNYLNSVLATPLEDFKPADFQVVKQKSISNGKYSYKLFISDATSGFIFMDFSFSELPEYQFLSIESLNLHEYLNRQVGQYTLPTTKFLSFQFVWDPIYEWSSDELRVYPLILTSDVSQYGFKFVFSAQPTSNTLLNIKALSAVIVKYGDWTPMNKLAIQNQNLQLAIPYYQKDQIVVAVYNIDIIIENPFATVVPTISVGTYEVYYSEGQWLSPLNLAVFFSKKGSILFVSQLQGPLQSYGIYKSPILTLKNQDRDLKSQDITLFVKNNFYENYLTFKLYVQEVDNHECTAKITNLQIYPSTGEVLTWNLSQNIFDGVSLKYHQEDTDDFTIIQPTTQIGQSIDHKQVATQIVSAKALLTQNGAWSNQFGFLNKIGSKYQILYSDTPAINAAPSFNQVLNVKKIDANLNCLDFVQLSVTSFVIDCQIQNNKFLILIKDTDETQTTPIANTQLNRALGTYKINDLQFVVRVTLSITNDGQLANDSFVELFQYASGQLQAKQTLDKSKLSTIYGKQIDELNIVDFKIGLNGSIYLLDAKLGIFVVNYDIDWKFQKLITFRFGQTFAFDRTILENKEEAFVVQGYNYYIVIDSNGQTKKVQDLQFNTITYPQSISASANFVFVKHQSSLYVYHSDDSNTGLIDLIESPNLTAIVNPFIQEIVTLSLQSSARWNISLGSLKFNGVNQASQGFKDLTIIATSQHKLTCSTRIQYQVIESSSKAPIKKNKSDQPFPQVFDDIFEQFQLGNLISGPNLEYSLSLPKTPLDFSAQVVQNREIQVSNWPKTPLYSTELVGNDRETLFQIFQTQDKKLTISICVLTDHIKYVCQDYGNVQLQEKISDQLFSIWQDSDNIVRFITISTSYKVTSYLAPDGIVIEDKTISFEEKEGQQIVSILNQGEYLFILQKNGVLNSYQSEKFSFVNQITGNALIGYGGQWKPIKLYGNRMLKSNIVFVQNENNIALINYINTEFIFVKQMDYTQNTEIHISAAKDSFFFANDKEILEYNYSNLLNIFKSKTVELFGYTIATPLTVTSQLSTGNLVIKTSKAQDIYLNIFRPSLTQHDTFYLAFKLNGVKQGDPFQLSLGGSLYIITLANGEKIQQLNFILLNPELIVIPIKKLQKFVSNFHVIMDIMNGDDQTQKVHYEQDIKVANTFTSLIVNDEEYLKSIEINENDGKTEVAIRSDWIGGQIISTELSQQSITDDITLLPFVSQDQAVLMDYSIYDVAKPQAVTFLQASNTVLSFKGDDLKNAQPVLTKLSEHYKCFRLEADSTRLYSVCNNGVEDQIQVATCDDKQKCQRENAYISAPFATQIAALAQDVIVVLHTDSLNPENYDGYITIRKLVQTDGIWSSTTLLTIDYDFIKQKFGAQAPKQFRPSSFIHSPTGNSVSLYYLQLIITDSVNGLLFVDLTLSKTTSELQYQFSEYKLLKDWLNIDQYATDDTHYYQAQIVTSQVEYPTKKTLKLALVTDISSSYVFELVFAIQANVSCKLSTIRTIFVLNRYGNFKALNYVSASSSSIAIPYVNNLEVIIGVYKIPTDLQNGAVQTIQGSHTFAHFKKQITPQDFLIYNTDSLFLTSTTQMGVYQNQVRYQQVLKFGEPKNLHNQKLTLTFQNDFRRVVRTIDLSIIPVNKDECKTKLTDLKIYPSQGEVMQWALTQNFFDGVSLKYSVDQADFSVVQPLTQVGQSVNHIQVATQIVSAKALLTQNGAWSNQFGFLNNDGLKYSIYYSDTPAINGAPSFNQVLNIKKMVEHSICGDFVQLSKTEFVVDCQINDNKNLIYLNGNIELNTIMIEDTLMKRLLGSYQIKEVKYVVRVALSITSEGQLAHKSYVELFQIQNDGPIHLATLDKAKLAEITFKQIDELNIVDFKIGLNGQIYLLDAKMGIFVVYFDKVWKFSRFIEQKFGQAFAFDRAVLSNKQEIFAIKGYNYYGIINKDGKIIKIQDLPFASVTYPQQIRLSGKYVFLQNQGNLYIYHSDENNTGLIDIVNLTNSAGIVNPNSQEIVTVSLTSSSAWSFSLGSLKFNGNAQASTNFKAVTIQAKSQHNQMCYSRIYYQVLASNSETIYKKVETETPFPNVLDENDEQIKLGSLVSGPNLIYEIVQPKSPFASRLNQFLGVAADPDFDVNAQIAHQRSIQVTNWPKKALYQTSLVANNQETLFQVFQQEDKKLIIYSCELVDHVKYECKEYGNLQVQVQLSDQIFSIWQDSDNVVRFITLDTPFIIKFLEIKNNKTVQYGSIKLNEAEEKDELKAVAFQNQGENLFVIQESGVLSSYSTESFLIINSITGQNLIGFQGEWKPIKLYGNRILRQNVILVQNENNVVIINYQHQEFIYGSNIAYTKGNQIYIAQATNSLFLVNNKDLSEYNYEQVNNVFKQKTVELFGYQITQPLSVSSHLKTGILVVRTTKNENVYLNIYKPDQLQHETFYLAVKINGKVDDAFTLSVSGSDPVGSAYIVALANGEAVQQLEFVVLDPELILIPNKQKQKYLTDYEVSINVKNADSQNNNILPFTQKVKVINTFTSLIVDDTKATQQIEIEAKQNSTAVKLTNGWISGQQAYCTLTQEKANDIVVQSYLYETKNSALKNYQFKDAQAFQKNVIFQAMNNVLLMKDNKLEESTPLLEALGQEYDCFRLTSFEKSIYSVCNNGVEDQIQVATCDDKQKCQRENAYISAPFATQIAALAQDIIVVLHTDSLNPENYDGYITIRKLVQTDGIWSSTTLLTIDYDFIQQKLGAQAPKQFRPSSFVHSLTHSDDNSLSVQFIISDSVNGLAFIDFSFPKNTYEPKYLFMEYQLLQKWLNDNKHYANDNTHYYANKIVEESIKEKIKSITLVVVTDNSSSYVFNLQFAILDNQSNKLTKTEVKVALNRYGTWKALNTVAANKQSVVVAFYNNSKVVVGVYHITENAISVINGSFSFTTQGVQKLEPVDFLLYLQESSLIASKVSKGLQQYEIRNDITLSFGESAKLENQTLTITFSNDYRQVSKQIKLSIKPDDGGDDDDSSGSNAWWITLVVVGSLIVLGLIGFFFYKKRKDNEEEQEDQDTGYAPLN
ncbi:unnamed protein product (macronuclear) [Paramecium tetraurelia]|uniref:Uncharacterized protein n=1 Tax=Paramecium tetraurelia TaxID=5888 RepID=A0CCX7_PARTE|nr:uncharacterized protein GSPATT00037429001 [Paramecium tetraurelia]CAK68644.1 unnamed protein product [Paramecium tetraurelia]|eukprot:XP_001436041.1 hypothetical protein (macronuclear) [Paramecium tetraurelia strain d4-2]